MLKKIIFISLFFISTTLASSFVELPSRFDVTQTVNKLIDVIKTKQGFQVFAVVDHEKNALSVSMKMPQTVLILFGNPTAGTLLMQENPLMAYELPLKILVAHKRGKAIISYRDPRWLAQTYSLYGSKILGEIDKVLKEISSSCL